MNKHRWLSFVKFEKIRGIEVVIFALILLFLPVNLAKHFFFNFSYVDGILVDYLIPAVYLTDILIWILLGIWGFRGVRGFRGFRRYRGDPLILYSSFFILASGLSVFFAQNQPAAVYKWLKLVEYVLLAFYVSKNINLKKDFPAIVKILFVGVLLESVLVILQWFKQGSIFGYWFFGENKYTVSTPGIAVFDLFGVKKVRPYGTFPHPNVLSGYLAVVLPWVFYELKSRIKNKELGMRGRGFYLSTLVLGLAALTLSFSRSAWVVGGLGILGAVGFRWFRWFRGSRCLSLLSTLSFLRRAELNWIALEMLKDHSLLGVGLNNFTVAMDNYGKVSGWTRFLQPVHNVYLLVVTETGLIGLIVFLCLLFSIFRLLWEKKNYLLFVSMVQIALLCSVDHYFFTLQQTSLLFWLIVGLVFSTVDKV